MKAILTEPQSTDVYWIELEENRSGRGGERTLLNIHSAPLHVGPLIQKHLWNTKQSIVLTSATLRTAKTFNFVVRESPQNRQLAAYAQAEWERLLGVKTRLEVVQVSAMVETAREAGLGHDLPTDWFTEDVHP